MTRRGRSGRDDPRAVFALLESLPELGLSGIEPLAVAGTPEGVVLATARSESGRETVVAASRSDSPAALGWAAVGWALRGGTAGALLVAAPSTGRATRELARWMAEAGWHVRLAAIPALAEEPDEVASLERFPEGPDVGDPGWSLAERLARVLDGACAASGAGAVRSTGRAWLALVHGRAIAVLEPGPAGLTAEIRHPERRQIHVNRSNFERWARELHRLVLEAAADRALADSEEARRIARATEAAERSGIRVTALWVPGFDEQLAPLEWVGIDEGRRAVAGIVRARLGPDAVPAALAALHRLVTERERWAPGSMDAPPRVLVAADEVDGTLERVLARCGLVVERASLARPAEAPAPSEAREARERAERRGRRRGRRRRRGRGETISVGPAPAGEGGPERPRRFEEEPLDVAALEELALAALEGTEPGGESAAEGEREGEPTPGAEEEEGAEPVRERTGEGEAASEEGGAAASAAERRAVRHEAPAGARLRAEEGAIAEAEDEEGLGAEELEPDEEEIGEESEEEPEDEGEELEVEPAEALEVPEPEVPSAEAAAAPAPRRRPRAAIVARTDPDTVVAALVLARERRHVVSFYTCPQDALMDYFRTRATDFGDNVDLLVVGFTAQPVPKEIVGAAELYRGRIQWFDHHRWPIEDLEALRAAIGREAVFVREGAANVLAAIAPVLERRSRFTDKLVDFLGGRLGENDMRKWGERLAAFVRRLATAPGEHRPEIGPVLAGKPTQLPDAPGPWEAEARWLEEHDPRLVHFGEYSMVVVQVPAELDAKEIARRLRCRTRARLSLAAVEGADVAILTAAEEKRPLNVAGLAEQLAARLPWVELLPSADRSVYLLVRELGADPGRLELLVAEIAKHKSILYG